jgi:carboxyl-terminal processing protease
MASPDTISSGDGVTMIFSRTVRGAIISRYGSNGAFGMNAMQAILPPDLYVLLRPGHRSMRTA